MKRKITVVVAIAVCVAAGATVAAIAAEDQPGDEVATVSADPPAGLLEQQQAAVAAAGTEGSVEPSASPVTGVIDSNGEFIECAGKDLLVEERGAQGPVAYLEGERDDGVAIPGGPQSEETGSPSTYAPRCGADDEVTWREFGG